MVHLVLRENYGGKNQLQSFAVIYFSGNWKLEAVKILENNRNQWIFLSFHQQYASCERSILFFSSGCQFISLLEESTYQILTPYKSLEPSKKILVVVCWVTQ